MTDKLNKPVLAAGSLLLAIVNFLAALNLDMPSWFTAQGVNLLQGAALAIVSLVTYVLHARSKPDVSA